MSVLIETTLGDIVVDLFIKERPNCCRNFLKLCKIKYYNLCQVFSIEPNYILQSGDPKNTGRGGKSIFGILYGEQARYFDMEMVPKIKHARRGLISFVNNGSGLLGSRFFITLADDLDYLDDKHCVFGQISEGFETLDNFNATLVDDNNRPFKDIRISHTIILDDPFEDPPTLRIPSRSPSPSLNLLQLTNQLALDEKEDEDEGKTEEQIQKEMEEKEMKAQAQILEMVGDLHYADEKPPDNVLFVCKLNPVTTSEDLEIIFSRFGDIVECEVIKDRRTQQSLQYAFIEFKTPQQCEAAYLKMDNVLIDDRRIHVDFSQSVSKNFQWKKQAKDNGKSRSPSLKRSNRRSQSPSERKRNRRRSRSRDRDGPRRRRSRTPDRKERRRRSPTPDRRKRRRSDSEEEDRRHRGDKQRYHRHR